jgi:hypothetical protein
VGAALGAAITIAGAVSLVRARRRNRERLELAIVPTSGGAFVSLGGAF